MLAICLGSLTGASYSGFCKPFQILSSLSLFIDKQKLINPLEKDGRKPAYLIGMPLLFIGSIGVAASQTISQLIVWRFVQTIGASPGLAVGSAVIGDIYKVEERGRAMGISFAVEPFLISSPIFQ